MKKLEDFLKPKQSELYKKIIETYTGQASVYYCEKKYILVCGEAPIMLVAHLDTVHHEPVKNICYDKSRNIVMSPQGIGGDDRCGVFALATAYEKSAVKPWLLFTCDEEIGGVGAEEFCYHHESKGFPSEIMEKLSKLKMLIEIDRKGKDDAVYYDCDNKKFEKYITGKGFKTAFGSFSDISYVAPRLGVAAVNLSSGYYNAHTQHEYINRKHLNATIDRVLSIISDVAQPDFPKYEFIRSRLVGRFGEYGEYMMWGCKPSPKGKSTKKNSSKKKDEIDDELEIIDFSEDYPDVPASVPAEYQSMYHELLDFYSLEELEFLREENGDWVIEDLYIDEIGYPDYSAQAEAAEEENVWVPEDYVEVGK